MSGSTPAPARPRSWYARPAIVLPFVAAVVLAVAVLTPEPSAGRLGDSRLSVRHAGSMGAQLLGDMAGRLGWQVVRRDSSPIPLAGVARGGTIHAVLAPVMRPTRREAHAYLEAVRGGDALLLVIDRRNPLSDSLQVWRTSGGGVLEVSPADSAHCTTRDLTPSLWPDGDAHVWGLRWITAEPTPRVTFARVRLDASRELDEAATGFTLGKGRVVVVSDPDLLRNDVVRRCRWGIDVASVRMLEWLRDGGERPRTRLEFDEYHQGYGPHASMLGTMGEFLGAHPVGRAILQLALGALVLLFALAPRALLPIQRLRVERRDPLEQVDALAHAYEQVGATRTAVLRLLHGVRARVERVGTSERARPDDRFLDDVVAADADRAADTALVRRALREPAAAGDLPLIGAALRRIEHTFTTSRA